MTIYDVLRVLVAQADWGAGAGGDVEARRRKEVALRLVDRLEDQGLLGQVALDVTEEF